MEIVSNRYKESYSSAPIGVFDSGVGGLSVVRAIRELLPAEEILYVADQANVPYGDRNLIELQEISSGITRYLLTRGAKLVVVACNTASAAALHYLRDNYPSIPFVGMEPALKPAALSTSTGNVGVLATPNTFQSSLYSSLINRFASDIEIYQDTCPGLVCQIENGAINSLETRKILERALQPMINHNVDRIVLGCTHYPFVIPLIEEIIGDEIKIIDPSPAVARQVKVLLEKNCILYKSETGDLSIKPNLGTSNLQLVTSGDQDKFEKLVGLLLEFDIKPGEVHWGKDLHR